jgi:AraC family transcriptional regulator, arabinose operon regulatory protein
MIRLAPDDFILKPACAKIVCEPSWRWQKRDFPMPNYDLFYVWSGEGEVECNGEIYPVGAGSCFLFRPNDVTSATHNPQKPLVLTYIHFDVPGVPEELPALYRRLEDKVDFEALLTRYVRLFLMETYGREEEARLILKQLMIYLLREDQGNTPSEGASRQLVEVIREAANYIRQHPGSVRRVEDLAARAQLSPRYFSMKFKEIVGETVQSYMIQAKIDRAEHLLHYAGMTVSEVAYALGYRDVFFFSRQFKQYTGKNPSDVR